LLVGDSKTVLFFKNKNNGAATSISESHQSNNKFGVVEDTAGPTVTSGHGPSTSTAFNK